MSLQNLASDWLMTSFIFLKVLALGAKKFLFTLKVKATYVVLRHQDGQSITRSCKLCYPSKAVVVNSDPNCF